MKTFWPDCPRCGVNDRWIATEEGSAYAAYYRPDGGGWSMSDEQIDDRDLWFRCESCETDLMDMESDSKGNPIPPAELELTKEQLKDRSFDYFHPARPEG